MRATSRVPAGTRVGVCAPLGFAAAAVASHARDDGDIGRLDVALVRSERPCEAAGVFTRNAVKAAPVVISQLNLRQGHVQAVVYNSGQSNACTGAQGFRDALQMCKAAADSADLDPSQVLVCSTGVIGVPVRMDRVVRGVREAAASLSAGGGEDAARAIMTTDTVPKTATAAAGIRGSEYTVGGMAKGSGMIHPEMATMLALVTTDAPIAAGALAPLVRRVADDTLNCVTVDGDCSTNDTLLVLANGAAGGEPFTAGSDALAALEEAIRSVCDSLAAQLAADGEGATKHFRVEVCGAADTAQARAAARRVAASPLVKTAIHGADPNWGRIVMALGHSGASMVLDRLRVRIGDSVVFDRGAPLAIDLDAVRAIFARNRVDIVCDLGAGDGAGHAWGCDLTAEYVRINADYTT